jgi:S-adenosylmethionine:tRNA ribosyltransferase-isomerase
LDRDTGDCQHASFGGLPQSLRPGSLVVLNDTRVIPARLVGKKPTGRALEVLLIRPAPPQAAAAPAAARATGAPQAPGEAFSEPWEVLARNLGGLAPGARVRFGDALEAELIARGARGLATLRFSGRAPGGLLEAIERVGEVPLPPYIASARQRSGRAALPDERARYQTVFARVPGAVAAPTAGLHFTRGLLDALKAAGHEIAWLTLHVGPGTFRPVESEDPEAHVLEPERYEVSEATAAALAAARARGRPIVAVGTTVVRALEDLAAAGEIRPRAGETSLFIRPGFRFRVVTDLITNFHLPRSTLLMLVCAFAGRERVLAAYGAAVERGYRFYSYGDAMLIRPADAAARDAALR